MLPQYGTGTILINNIHSNTPPDPPFTHSSDNVITGGRNGPAY